MITLGLPLLAGTVAVLILIARWVFRPLDQAARGREAGLQFTLLDLLCLVLLAQLPTGLTAWAFQDGVFGGVWIVYGFAWIACATLWWATVRTLSRAGIVHRWHRAAVLALVLPAAVFGSIAVPPLTIVLLLGLFLGGLPGGASECALLLLGECVSLGALYACGRYTRWLAAQPVPPEVLACPPETPLRAANEESLDPLG